MIICKSKCAMNIHVTKDAASWYKKAYDIYTASLRFFVRYGGFGGNVSGFSLGVLLEEPLNTHTSIKVNDILFFVTESDVWYFEDKVLHISYDEENNEPHFAYQYAFCSFIQFKST